MKKTLFILSLAMAISLSVFGCGRPSSSPKPSTSQSPAPIEDSTPRFEFDGISFEIPDNMSFVRATSGADTTTFVGSNDLGEIIVSKQDEEYSLASNPHTEQLYIDGFTVLSEQAGDNGVVQMYRLNKDGNGYQILIHCPNFETLDQLVPIVIDTLRIS